MTFLSRLKGNYIMQYIKDYKELSVSVLMAEKILEIDKKIFYKFLNERKLKEDFKEWQKKKK